MTFSIRVDTEPWRAHALATRDGVLASVGPDGGVIPVIKGNGYGLGDAALAAESVRLGVSAVAVGTVYEAAAVASAFPGDVVVLEPADPRDTHAYAVWTALDSTEAGPRLVRTIASEEGWHAAIDSATAVGRPVRALVEALTSMHRFGLDASDIARLLTDPRIGSSLVLEGLALHLPIAQPPGPRSPGGFASGATLEIAERGSARAREAIRWALMWTSLLSDRMGASASDGMATVWASHLDDSELASVRSAVPGLRINARMGTRLWHGNRATLSASGTVLDVHITDLEVGYRQRRPPAGGGIIVVSGGTSHGVALAAPSSVTSLRARVNVAGAGALEASGRTRSPFRLRGEQLWFAETPHVSVSLLRLPKGVVPPRPGDELDCQVRYSTTRADLVRWV